MGGGVANLAERSGGEGVANLAERSGWVGASFGYNFEYFVEKSSCMLSY